MVAHGQEGADESLSLSLRRNFGYSLGAQMQGTFSIRADGPADMIKVEFLLDGQVIGEDDNAPFSIGLNTRDYAEGVHSFAAIGTAADGKQLKSQSITRQFVATSATRIVVIAIVALVIMFRLASYFLARRASGSPAKGAGYGLLGGAVCPNCGRPFAIHWWSIRLGVGRLDRCQHCHKWNMVSRAATDQLIAAEESFDREQVADPAIEASQDEAARRRRIEESRYDQR